MNLTFLIVVLSLVAMLAILVYAILGKKKVDELRSHPRAPAALQPDSRQASTDTGSPRP